MSVRSLPIPTATENDEEEDDNEEPNENKVPSNNVIQEVDEHHPTKSIKVMTESEKLSGACFGMVIRNSCKQVIYEYFHDKAIIAVARDKQFADLMAACDIAVRTEYELPVTSPVSHLTETIAHHIFSSVTSTS